MTRKPDLLFLSGPIAALALLASGARADSVVDAVVSHARQHAEGEAPFSFDASAYGDDLSQLPIGVFDSGIGGLTVMEAILSLDAFNNDNLQPGPDGRKDFENERFIYFADQANMPYGNYPSAGKEDYLRELILKDAVFLLGKRWRPEAGAEPKFDKPPVKAIVIACNTATAYGLESIRAALQAWNLPVIVVGVVEAGARGVNEQLPDDGKDHAVAILATVGTCASNAYPKAIGKVVGLAGKTVPKVVQQGSVGLAGAIEGDPSYISTQEPGAPRTSYQGPAAESAAAPLEIRDLDRYGFNRAGLLGEAEAIQVNSVENYARYDVTVLVENYRKSGGVTPIDTVVLGCTHYPLAQADIAAAFERLRTFEDSGALPYDTLIAPKIRFVNPAELTARELFRGLASARLRLKDGSKRALGSERFYISVANPGTPGIVLTPDGGLDRDYKYGRTQGQLDREDTVHVPMTPAMLPAASLNLIRTRLPEVWRRLGGTD